MLGTVRGLFFENDSIKHLTKGINAIIDGRLWLPRKIMEDHILNPPDHQPKQTKPQLTPKETEAWPMFEEAMATYYRREFDRASDLFADVLTLLPTDKPARSMAERCMKLVDEPPGDDWTGEVEMREK